MVIDKIAEIARIIKSVPDKNDLKEQKLDHGFKMVVASKLDGKSLSAPQSK